MPPSSSTDDFRRKFSVWHLLDPSRPWVLVPEGSFGGFFDWVPAHFRIGPWCATAIAYLTAIYYLAFVAGCYLWLHHESWKMEDLRYPGVGTLEWTYQVVTSVWMLFIIYLVWIGPMGLRAWATYTIQSWSLLTLRHILAALVPLAPNNYHLLVCAELIRFPAACSATVTFGIFNLVLAPYVYFFSGKTAKAKQEFVQFIFSFRLVQIHVFNLLFGYLNVAWASPPRALTALDLYLSIVSVLLYTLWYLGVMDRLGIHVYPIFTPRDSLVVVTSWTFLTGVYLANFAGWRWLLLPPAEDDTTATLLPAPTTPDTWTSFGIATTLVDLSVGRDDPPSLLSSLLFVNATTTA